MMDDLSYENMIAIQAAIRSDRHESELEHLASVVLLVADLMLAELIEYKERNK